MYIRCDVLDVQCTYDVVYMRWEIQVTSVHKNVVTLATNPLVEFDENCNFFIAKLDTTVYKIDFEM